MIRDNFGWDLPPGTTDADIDDAFEGGDREDCREEDEDAPLPEPPERFITDWLRLRLRHREGGE